MSTGLVISRSTPVEAQVRDGRVVEAYAAVFGVPAEIVDQQGHYSEEIDRTAFNKAIKDAAPAGKRSEWLTGVFYNHGLTIHGDSAPEFSVPLGRTTHIEADSTGVLTLTEYAETRLAGDILELIKQGAIRAQSFTGKIIRSTPELARGSRYRPDPRTGVLPTVRRLELGLREYGPTPIPAYQAAEVVGVRSALLNALAGGNSTLLRALLDATTDDDPLAAGDVEAGAGQSGTAPDGQVAGDAPHEEGEHSPEGEPLGGPESVHVARSSTAGEWALRMQAALRARGIK